MNNVTAMQTQQHSVCDTVITSIVGNPQQPLPYSPYTNTPPQIPLNYTNVYYNGSQNPQVIQAQKRLVPGGVAFSFEPIYQNPNNNYPNYVPQEHGIPSHSNPPSHNQSAYYYNQQLIQQQIALKQIEKEALELMLIQEHLNKSMGKLKFHHHGQTSTTDLFGGDSRIPKSKGMPDFNNLMAVLNDLKRELKEMEAVDFSYDCPSALYSEVSTAKKLMLTKSPDHVEKEQRKKEILLPEEIIEHADSQVEPEQTQNTSKPKADKNVQSNKKVCFKGFQSRPKKRKPRKSKKKRSRRRSSHSESSTVSSQNSSSDSSEDSDSYRSSE
ncbi:hypothetical protein ILUMI_10491 [Ignelater luminosus]|uniref:Uncharacterized protein n=1 Tax=Ignelater luminosus TaxID=2038154 RepID=A0A8K0GE54_IGNLU|nr:hypothetical protein ILUMI_10491 [Ignelater luminosus]